MKKTLLLLLAACFLFSCDKSHKKTKTNYSDIADGLLPAVIIGDSLSNNFSIEEQMKKYNVPSVSLAVFKDGEIVWEKAYGYKDAKLEDPAAEETKFQAASISKSVTALGVLKLAEENNLNLDADINQYLNSWKIKSRFLKNEAVTIRRLLSHTAGTKMGGFPGYEKSDTIPSTLDILTGKGQRSAIELDTVPGVKFMYSNEGYVILQLLIEEVSGNSFEQYFEKDIFSPLKMTHTTFNQLPKTKNVSIAHDKEGTPYPGEWAVYPEMSAAGLWTTPSDLARFCIAVENAFYGYEDAFISQKMAQEMLTPVQNWGLGVGLRGENEDAFFFHGGSNPEGYKCLMVDAYKKRTGIVIMTNGEQGDKVHDDIVRSFSSFFDINVREPKYVQPIDLSQKELLKYTGRYQFREMGDYFLEIYLKDSNKIVLYDPNDKTKHTYVPISKTDFVDIENGLKSSFVVNTLTGEIKAMNYSGVYTFHKED
jgi:CubicO group peptidase (beta-lactamase class C family)